MSKWLRNNWKLVIIPAIWAVGHLAFGWSQIGLWIAMLVWSGLLYESNLAKVDRYHEGKRADLEARVWALENEVASIASNKSLYE